MNNCFLDKNGNFIKQYNSINDAVNDGYGHVGEVCSGKRKSTNNKIFKYQFSFFLFNLIKFFFLSNSLTNILYIKKKLIQFILNNRIPAWSSG